MNEHVRVNPTPSFIGVMPSHLPNRRAELADRYLVAMLNSAGTKTFDVPPESWGRVVDVTTGLACALAEAMEREWARRGWMIEVPTTQRE